MVSLMFGHVDTRNARAVQDWVQGCYLEIFPQGDPDFVPKVFGWVVECFEGKAQGYQAIDARYHDLEHTLQGTLCLSRLLLGRRQARATPPLSRRMHELCLLAILFHDTGYLKRREDTAGTGAKYTAVHVSRSANFAHELLSRHGYPEGDIAAVQNMIRCTGVNARLDTIPFQTEEERIAGFALGTADLLGQMAAADYVDKLPTLFLEFAEAARFQPDWGANVGCFASAEELMGNTPHFWSDYVWPRIDGDFQKLYRFLNEPFPEGENPYLLQVERNLARLAKLKK